MVLKPVREQDIDVKEAAQLIANFRQRYPEAVERSWGFSGEFAARLSIENYDGFQLYLGVDGDKLVPIIAPLNSDATVDMGGIARGICPCSDDACCYPLELLDQSIPGGEIPGMDIPGTDIPGTDFPGRDI